MSSSTSLATARAGAIAPLLATRAPAAVILIRCFVGVIFAGEGVLKFLRPETLGPGRFETVGIPAPYALAYADGVAEIICGAAILVGLLVRLAAIPMIVDMLGALAFTKVPLLWGDAPLYPREHGVWDFFHEGRLEFAMLCGSLFLLLVGSGRLSVDARWQTTAGGPL
jgi:putative oxidoreductase